jgi:hypothetical protein
MQAEVQVNSETIERLHKQGGLLRRKYLAEFANDPTSRATSVSRSNLIALRHTLRQTYGDCVTLDVTNALGLDSI